MNEVLVKNWNARVGKNDLVIFLGDFSFKDNKKATYFINQLNGNITFVKGNHDRNNSLNTRIISLNMMLLGQTVYCTHNPRNYNRRIPLNLVGHVHEKWKIQRRGRCILVNVGVDVWNFVPVSINEIIKAVLAFTKAEK